MEVRLASSSLSITTPVDNPPSTPRTELVAATMEVQPNSNPAVQGDSRLEVAHPLELLIWLVIWAILALDHVHPNMENSRFPIRSDHVPNEEPSLTG